MTTDKFHMVAIDLETTRALEDSRPATEAEVLALYERRAQTVPTIERERGYAANAANAASDRFEDGRGWGMGLAKSLAWIDTFVDMRGWTRPQVSTEALDAARSFARDIYASGERVVDPFWEPTDDGGISATMSCGDNSVALCFVGDRWFEVAEWGERRKITREEAIGLAIALAKEHGECGRGLARCVDQATCAARSRRRSLSAMLAYISGHTAWMSESQTIFGFPARIGIPSLAKNRSQARRCIPIILASCVTV